MFFSFDDGRKLSYFKPVVVNIRLFSISRSRVAFCYNMILRTTTYYPENEKIVSNEIVLDYFRLSSILRLKLFYNDFLAIFYSCYIILYYMI